jgi:hypothetical protein
MCARAAWVTLESPPRRGKQDEVVLTLDIHVNEAGRLAGTMRQDEHGPARPFDGALELLALLEALFDEPEPAPQGAESAR